jgi:membrane protein
VTSLQDRTTRIDVVLSSLNSEPGCIKVVDTFRALGDYINAVISSGYLILRVLDFIASFALITILFAAIYKVLPDKWIAWRDVTVGAIATALLFSVGKFLISLYLGGSTIASSYGAAGGLIIALLWVYYSAQIFLLGAEFTKVYAHRHGSRARP